MKKVISVIIECIVIFVIQFTLCRLFGVTYPQAFEKGIGNGIVYMFIVIICSAGVFEYLESFRKKKSKKC